MGLDIYLYRYGDFEATQKLEDQYERESEENWNRFGEYDNMTDDQKEEARKKDDEINSRLGLHEWGSDEDRKQRIEHPSKTDPEHYFKIGYFRSSYNEGGIERVLGNLGIDGMREIFCPNDAYEFRPNWEEALKKTDQSISALEKENMFVCYSVEANMFRPTYTKSAEDAISTTKEMMKKETMFDGGFSNIDGEFYPNGMEIFALLPGKKTFLKQGIDCTYVVYKGDKEWYLNALKIVKETIEYVLNKEDKDKYYLHWSG